MLNAAQDVLPARRRGYAIRPLIARAVAAQAITPAEAGALVPFQGTIKQTGAASIKHPPVRRGTRTSADAAHGSK
jgi:hypothetical protein